MSRARILADYVAGGTTAAEFDYLDGVTSNIQTQLAGPTSKPLVHAIGDASTNPSLTTSFVVVTAWTEITDQGSNFATGVFTAPQTGIYLISVICSFYETDANDLIYGQIQTSNRNYTFRASEQNDQYPGGELNHSIFADLDAADTAKFAVANSTDTDCIYTVGTATLKLDIALL